jgi:uncharacterized protein involved in exopolysaccharide biosynthesis
MHMAKSALTVSPKATNVAEDELYAPRSNLELFSFFGQRTDQTIGLLGFWRVIKRRMWLFAGIVLSCTFFAAVASYTIPKTYTATAEVVLERKDIRPFATDASLQSLDRDR